MMTVTGNKAQDTRNAKIVLAQTPARIHALIANSTASENDLYDRCIRANVRECFTAARVVSAKLAWYRPAIGL